MIADKGGFGAVAFDADAELIPGEVVKVRDGITFQRHSVAEVQLAFHESGDDHREFCRRRSESLAKTRSGPFDSRISPDLHRPAHIAPTLAVKRHNASVTEKLQGALQRNTAVTSPHHATASRSQAPPAEAQGPCMTGGSPGAARE